ncbi:MAG: hypothetical protein ACFE9S_15580 [Candidatus Hermodarchaeota archaeon]
MTNFTDIVKEKLRNKFDPYSEMSNDELNNIYNEINEDKELEDINNYFTNDDQIDLISNGINLIIAKKYNIETGKNPIHHKKITNIFKKWLKTRYPDELELLKENDDIQEAIEEVKEEKNKYLTAKDIKKKIREYQAKNQKIDTEIFEDEIEENSEIDQKEEVIDDDFDIFEEDDTSISNNKVEKIEKKTSQIIIKEPETLPIKKFNKKAYPSEEEIEFLIKRHKFVKTTLLDEHDIVNIKKNKYIKKSGWRKFINAFGISIELIDQKVYEKFNDKHAEVRVRAIAPNGQSVEGIGLKSWSELYEKTIHNLIANAWTRAVNRAVSDLVGYGEVSAEELENGTENGDKLF